MDVDLFDFDLPESAIALRPASPRDAARLLHVPAGDAAFSDHIVRDLPDLLREGDAIVVNDTRVIPARLVGRRMREGGEGAQIEATLLERLSPDTWQAFARPGKRLQIGDTIDFGTLAATVTGRDGARVTLHFDRAGADLDAAIALCGTMPLPPYIARRRAPDARDNDDYQTAFAREAGAVAAPTAGLHFTPELIARLDQLGIARHAVTLHVGAGTFSPVATPTTDAHVMHSETGALDAATADALNRVRARGGRITAIGTTALRVLETAALPDGTLQPWAGSTDIFITPGYRFRAVDLLMTNFHLPRSTLFMLVSAFCGLDRMKAAYAHALRHGYRFYSYGDTSLLTRNDFS